MGRDFGATIQDGWRLNMQHDSPVMMQETQTRLFPAFRMRAG